MDNQSYPKISVVTVSYNQGEFIQQNIESVLAQGYPNFEHIVIDGGSTDNTLEILRSYPHLDWVSETDRGQGHALNKGFSKARGEIICWLNSDDWYAPGVFFEVAKEIAEYPIVLGAAQEVDRHGNSRQAIDNIERGFWDIFKYWVPYAWLAQPSVFFRRAALEQVKLAPQVYLDESLYFVMDTDLWMRLAMSFPFERRLARVCSYYRIYDENKTGKYPLATQHELSRLFHRYETQLCHAERPLTYIVPACARDPRLEQTIQSLVTQIQPNFEIILADYSSPKGSPQLRDYALELLGKYVCPMVRYVRADAAKLLEVLNHSAEQARGILLCSIFPGDILPPEFTTQALNMFTHDWLGAALISSHLSPQLKNLLATPSGTLNPSAVFEVPFGAPRFVARKAVWLDLKGFRHVEFQTLAWREFLLRCLDKSWMVSVNNPLQATAVHDFAIHEQEFAQVSQELITAQLLVGLDNERKSSKFSALKCKHKIGLELSPELIAKARHLLSMAPSLATNMSLPG